MKDDFHFLWGLPILKTKIDSNQYNKKDIINVIEKNYQKDSTREKWSASFFDTNIHHSLLDEDNENFEKPNYFYLKKTYNEAILKYFNNISFIKNFNFDYQIVNYTASKYESIMEPHHHIDCEFSMVHYLQFDENKKNSTIFLNPYTFFDYWENKKKFIDKTHNLNLNHSWLFGEWKHSVEEDDCIIFPSILRHFVRNKNTDKLRITISSNIVIK
jgi:hypothetical protein